MFGRDDFMPGADTALRNSMGATNAGTSAAVKASEGSSGHKHGKGGKGSGRKGFEPLHIQTMTQDRLQAALAASKVRPKHRCEVVLLLLPQRTVRSSLFISQSKVTLASLPKSGSRQAGNTQSGFFNDFQHDAYEEEDEDYPSGPPAILKLPGEGNRSPSPREKAKKSHSRKGLDISLSPSPSQSSISVSNLLTSTPKAASADQATTSDRVAPALGSRPGSRAASPKRGRSAGRKTPKSHGAEDVKLPMFKFDPLRTEDGAPLPGEGDKMAGAEMASKPGSPSSAFGDNGGTPSARAPPLSKKFSSSFSAEVRTDVNDKATFLEPPPGKFRREFSNDHPLAKGGTGKYSKELKKGVMPAGMTVEVPDHLKRNTSNVAETINVSSKIEKLTYTAQKRVVDPKSQIDALRKQQNETLKRIVMEERDAEAVREQTLRALADPKERQNLEGVSPASSANRSASCSHSNLTVPAVFCS
jgi:hypothetical protein